MKNFLLIFLLAVILGSCSTDFETNAPWKETMVVYGFLNPNDAVQYIRISKAYLGEGNALLMAKESDSLYYRDILDVKLERFLNDNLMETHALIRIDTIPKDVNGTFAAPYMVLYADTHSLHPSPNLDENIYKLTITNRESGLIVTASTKIIENFHIILPNSTSLVNLTGTVPSLTWKFNPSTRGKIYGITQYINYTETDTVTGIVEYKSVKWYLTDKLTTGNTATLMTFPFVKNDFYRLLGDDVVEKPNIKRALSANPFDVHISAGTEEVYTYMQVTEQNTGIVQDKPLYSNIEGGVGLFSSRTIQIVHTQLSAESKAALDTSIYTKDLNF